jgi:hypothetical protein
MESPSSSRGGAEAGEAETEDPVCARTQQLQHEDVVQHASNAIILGFLRHTQAVHSTLHHITLSNVPCTPLGPAVPVHYHSSSRAVAVWSRAPQLQLPFICCSWYAHTHAQTAAAACP